MTSILLLGAAAAAVADWIAVGRRHQAAQYVLKPLALALLLAVAATLGDQAPAARWGFTVAALSFSLLGDVLLMLPRDLFVPGLGAFLAAHLSYVAAFNVPRPTASRLAIAFLLVAAATVSVFLRLRRGMAHRGASGFAVPVAIYAAAIGAMAASALATAGAPGWSAARSALAIVGALLFMFSDALIGWNRFVRPLPWAPVTIMVTYHLAQGALVSALLGLG